MTRWRDRHAVRCHSAARATSQSGTARVAGGRRTSVREGLRALEIQGVIESRQGGGTFVRTADAEALVPPLAAAILRGQRELAEVLEVREMIEPGIAKLAASRATPEHVQELEQLLERQRECIRLGRPFVDEDTAF